MHEINTWLKHQLNQSTVDEWKYWRAFAKQASSLVPSTQFKYIMCSEIPTTTANRMAKEYLVYRAVYLNRKAIVQYFTLNHSANRAFNAYHNDEELCLHLAVSAIKLSEVCEIFHYII